MEITINIKAPELSQAIQALASALAEQPVIAITGGSKNANLEEALVMVGATYDALEAAVKDKNQPATPPETPKTPETTSTPTETTAITLEEVRAKLAALTQSGKQPQVKELLAKFGAKKLTDVPADKYAELLQEAEGI
jgi:hypothetical protein